SRRRHTRWPRDWSSDVCSSDLTRLHVAKRELHQLDLAENENLKLACDRFDGKELGGPKVSGPGGVDQDVEIASFRKRGIECLLDGKRIGQIETHWMTSRHLGDA